MKTSSFSKSYNGNTVLSLPSLEFRPATIYAILGANGAGKSTRLRILGGLEASDSGSVALKDISAGFLPQKPFALYMSTMKNLLANSDRDEAAEIRARKLITAMQLDGLENQNAKSLSGGETARMALCRLLMRDYEFLLLDEPTTAMDMESTLLAEETVRSYRDRTGCTVLLITHSVAQAKRLADEVIFLDHGRLDTFGPSDLLVHPDTPAFRKFLDFAQGTSSGDALFE